jgi:hypothetical protein
MGQHRSQAGKASLSGLIACLMGASMCLAGPLEIDGPLDQFGRPFQLSALSEDRLVVVAFLGLECPLVGA